MVEKDGSGRKIIPLIPRASGPAPCLWLENNGNCGYRGLNTDVGSGEPMSHQDRPSLASPPRRIGGDDRCSVPDRPAKQIGCSHYVPR